MRTWRLMGQYGAVTTAYTAFAVAGMASPFTPDFNGILAGIRVVSSRNAATSLVDHVGVKLTCANWRPNVMEVGGQGSGLQTAPAENQMGLDWAVQQPIIAGVPITLEGRILATGTNVTPAVFVYGCFEVA